ncbi:MAG: 2-isopropylmalate synthase, partial [Maritimibacter harenae]
YEGQFANDQRNGQGTVIYASGETVSGEWVNGVMESMLEGGTPAPLVPAATDETVDEAPAPSEAPEEDTQPVVEEAPAPDEAPAETPAPEPAADPEPTRVPEGLADPDASLGSGGLY